MSKLKATNLPVLNIASFSNYLQTINSIPMLTAEEEFLLAKNYLDNHDLDAAHKLVTSHLKLVAKIAVKYSHYGLPIADLVSEGNIGLMRAVKKYDPHLGYRLSTYAMWWIKAYIQEYILRSWSLVKMGTTVAQKKLFFGLGKAKRKIINLYSRAVNHNDYATIANELGVKESEVITMDQRLSNADKYLNDVQFKGDDDSRDVEMIDLLHADEPSQETICMDSETLKKRKNLLSNAICTLNEREANILTARKLQEYPATLEMLSNKYQISKERVRQIENRAFEKIKKFVVDSNGSECYV